MKSRIIISTLVVISLLAIVFQGCNKDDTPDTIEYIIKVDSIVHLDTINSADLFEVKFYGKVGDNDCFEFTKFSPAFGADFINMTLYGTETIKNDCAGDTVYLNGKGASFSDMTPGEWALNVFQPEGVAPIQSTVYVK